MDNAYNSPDLFAKLSPRVAGALAAHLGRSEVPSRGEEGRVALDQAWAAISPDARASYGPVFCRLHALSARQARPYLLSQAREAWGDTFPAVLRLLDAISTPDLAVRLYLESPSAAERAHFQLATKLLEQVESFQGQYVADVIPSRDRRERMARAMRASQAKSNADAPLQITDFVADDRFLIALHRGASLRPTRCFDGAQQLDPDLGRPEVELLVLFRFDTSLLIVKAPGTEQRASLRDAFVQIFVGDPRYFEPRGERPPRYRLTLGTRNARGEYRGILATAQASAPRVGERDNSLRLRA